MGNTDAIAMWMPQLDVGVRDPVAVGDDHTGVEHSGLVEHLDWCEAATIDAELRLVHVLGGVHVNPHAQSSGRVGRACEGRRRCRCMARAVRARW